MSLPAKVALKELVKGRKVSTPTNRHEMLEVSRRIINKNAKTVVQKIVDIALNDAHPEQMNALKALIPRIAPTTFYEKLADRANAGNKVNIQINVVGNKAGEPVVDDTIIVEVPDGK